jgi:hypothetical protein
MHRTPRIDLPVAAQRASAALALAAFTLAGTAATQAASGPRPGTLAPLAEPYAPQVSAADFAGGPIDNAWLPYAPGTRFTMDGVRGTTRQTDTQHVLRPNRKIQGVEATTVRDTVSENGRVVERTDDWYAQDRRGNVWYLGEASFERENGKLTRASDSWEWGVDGALPGIIMPAHPQRGDAYRQEHYAPGEALDQARVLKRRKRMTVLAGTYRHVLVTSERSPLEPQTERKYYVRGLGEIAENVVKGEHETFELATVTH